MTQFKTWFKDLAESYPVVMNNKELAEDSWNAAIKAAMDTAISVTHPQDWIRVGMALERLKS